MSNSVDLRNLNSQPFTIQNRVYVLGNPVISVETLDRLIYVLDQVGPEQPIVLVNPEATTVPGFEMKLSNLIQNNRAQQPQNVTTTDKYRFKDMTDRQLLELVTSGNNSRLDQETMLEMYRGLRARAQALYDLDMLSKERDTLWAAHCADPNSPAGSERFSELQYRLIPEAQNRYQIIVEQLQKYDVAVQTQQPVESPKPTNVAATSSVSNTVQYTQEQAANTAATVEIPQNPTRIEKKPWGPWMAARYKVMPLAVAKDLANSVSYNTLRQQQHNVLVDGVEYQAVDPAYLLSLGIKLVQDGVPIVYTEIGTFKRVGDSNVPMTNLDYWYPKPKGA